MRINRTPYLVIIVSLAVLATILSFFAWRAGSFPGDLAVLLWMQSFGNPVLLTIMQWVSSIFGPLWAVVMVLIAGLLLWWRIGRLEAALIVIAALLSQVDILLKLLINQSRPSGTLIQILSQVSGSGFPSGHAMFSILFLGTLAYILDFRLRKSGLRIWSIIFFSLLTLLVGLSRIYLGVHWPSEVLGGYLFGGIFLTALIWGYNVLAARGHEK